MNNKLPEMPSAVLAIALKDLTKVERSKKYQVDMEIWHDPGIIRNVCVVCFAGGVMAKTLNIDPKEDAMPGFGVANVADTRRLCMLNAMRNGDIIEGIDLLEDIKLDVILQREEKTPENYNKLTELEADVVEYIEDPGKFKKWMWKVQRLLKKMGL